MGLIKTIELGNTGFENTYHKISSSNIDVVTGGGDVSVISYKDQTARNNGKSPSCENTFQLPFGTITQEVLNLVDGNTITACYNYLKIADFTGATDA